MPSELSSSELEQLRDLSKRSFYFFAKFVCQWQFAEDWLNVRVHKPLCDALEKWETNSRVRVVFPRSWLKSTVVSIYYPLWRAINNPSIRVLIVQNSAANAEKKLSSIRSQVEGNELLRLLFPDLLPDKSCKWTNTQLELRRSLAHPEATFECAGTRTRLTSRHYDLIIEDDTVAPDLDELTADNVVPTKDDIEQAIGFHRLATPLLVDVERSQIVVVGTRWFDVDLLSWIKKNEGRFYTSIERAVRENAEGLPDRNGDYVYPERFGPSALEKLEASMGPYLFSCLYFNDPVQSADMVFQKSWFQYYETEPRDLVCFTTADPAGGARRGSKKNSSDLDYNVVLTAGKQLSTGRIYVLTYKRFRGTPGQLMEEIFRQQKLYSSPVVGLQFVGYENSLDYFMRELMRKRNQFFAVEAISCSGSKEARIRALAPVFSSGSILLRPWMLELQTEAEIFPLGAHDDLIETLAMQLQLWPMTGEVEDPEDVEYVPSPNDTSLEAAMLELSRRNAPSPGDAVNEYFPHMNFDTDSSRSFSFHSPSEPPKQRPSDVEGWGDLNEPSPSEI